MMNIAHQLILIVISIHMYSYDSFSYRCNPLYRINKSYKSTTNLCMKFIPTLDENTLWQLSLTFKKDDENKANVKRANMRIRFVKNKNYEPPQGKVFIEDDYNGLVKTNDIGYSGIWTLSEDKNDRKDGLWVWGLFEEPKYPFLYFYLDVYDTIIIEGGSEIPIFDNASIPNGRLLFRFDHTIDKSGHSLSNGQMTYKLVEYVKADPLGLGGNVNVGDDEVAGSVFISAFVPDESKLVID